LLCDLPAHAPHPLCTDCEADLPWLDERCDTCALPLALAGLTCAPCQRRPPAFDGVEAPWYFAFPVDVLISRFKHTGQWPLGRLLAQLLSQHLQHRFAEGLARPDLLLPVPMSSLRLRRRGFNQAAMLAHWLAAFLGIACQPTWLLRPVERQAQQELGAKARRANLHGVFALGENARVAGLHLALIDDVMTTGATAQVLAALLRQAGARRVDVYCLARTARPAAP